MLVFAMFVSAWMGVCQVRGNKTDPVITLRTFTTLQEVLYKKYGKHPREAMFYTVSPGRTQHWGGGGDREEVLVCVCVCVCGTVLFDSQHALPLPGFLLLTSDIWSKILVFSASGIL